MSFKDDELLQLELVITKSNAPIKELLDKLSHTVYGPNGDNGLRGDVRTLRDDVADLRGFKKTIIAVTATIQVVGIGILEFFKLK